VIFAADQLSRLVSHALKHQPWVYELELDESGWVSVAELLDAIRGLDPSWERVNRDDLVRIVGSSAKRRHEIDAIESGLSTGIRCPVVV
jgi:putative RNA 2'-phosphotransferase